MLVKFMNKEYLPDILGYDIKIIICGMAAGKLSCEWKHYFSNPSNKFWNILNESGFINQAIIPTKESKQKEENYKLLKLSKIGLTDLVKDYCGMDKKIAPKPKDIDRLDTLIHRQQPQFLAFNGKKSARKFLNKKKLEFGLQNNLIGKTKIYILPSTSSANLLWKKNKHMIYWKKLKNDLDKLFLDI
jgi:TDG/mug DNA glycosylase family protein